MLICFWMPPVMSTCVRMQFTHMLAGLGAMGTPQRQQSLQAEAGGRAGGRRHALEAHAVPRRCEPFTPAILAMR